MMQEGVEKRQSQSNSFSTLGWRYRAQPRRDVSIESPATGGSPALGNGSNAPAGTGSSNPSSETEQLLRQVVA